MKLTDFDYNLPVELIAQSANKPRDHARLLILDKKSGTIIHKKFYELLDYLKAGDVLVLNNSKVIPARLIGHKETGGMVEIFLLKKIKQDELAQIVVETKNKQQKIISNKNKQREVWECLIRKKVSPGMVVDFDNELTAKILTRRGQAWLVEFNLQDKDFMQAIEIIGQVPLPPYIKKELTADDKIDYQTVYADENKKGSVAAPTAGLHFTKDLLKKAEAKGIKIAYLTLHVGLGTFLPVQVENIQEHIMHAEWVEIKKEVLQEIKTAQAKGGRIIPVGTTSCRSLEAAWQKNKLEQDFAEWVDIFIYPGYQFKIVDALITNFHLPKSTL